VQRTAPDGTQTPYQVTDSVAHLSALDWCVCGRRGGLFPSAPGIILTVRWVRPRDRVVAVIAHGQEWQFKGFPPVWKTPTEIFAHGTCPAVRPVRPHDRSDATMGYGMGGGPRVAVRARTRTVKGFYFKYDDAKVDPKVAGWNVTVLSVRWRAAWGAFAPHAASCHPARRRS
jgi:hypothetical protein